VSIAVAPAEAADIPALATLLARGMAARVAALPGIWVAEADPAAAIASALRAALAGEMPGPQHWLVARAGGALVGVAHGMALPVPPIYAGRRGMPRLMLDDSTLAPDAPEGCAEALRAALWEAVDASAGDWLLVASAPGGGWPDPAPEAFAPLTDYMARLLPGEAPEPSGVRRAEAGDMPAIVTLSAAHRARLHELSVFWEPHDEADARFCAWMEKSLALPDREMWVSEEGGEVTGYVIAQPATRLHVPAGLRVEGLCVVDDFHHVAFDRIDAEAAGAAGPAGLLAAAAGAARRMGRDALLVVCPALWGSKRGFLGSEGFATALHWRLGEAA